MARSLYDIASDIIADYGDRGKNLPYCADPYVRAMQMLDTIDDYYYNDSGREVVMYALSNLGGWRGETARRVKAELKAML